MGRPASAAASAERFFEFSFLGLATSGYLAVAGSGCLDAPAVAIAALGLGLRALLISGILNPRLPPKAVNAAALLSVLFGALDYWFLSRDFLAAALHLIFFLAAIKLLIARTGRDFALLGVLAFFGLLAASVLSGSLTFFLCLAFFLLFGVAAFTSAEIRRSLKRAGAVAQGRNLGIAWRLSALTLVMVFGILALTGGLFFLLPRTAQAAFRHFAPERYRLAGFSSEVNLGQTGRIEQRKTAVMHVRFAGGAAPPDLKWRGAALSRFDGRRWFNPSRIGEWLAAPNGTVTLADDRQRRRPGRRISYEVQWQAFPSAAFFVAGTPEFLFTDLPRVERTSDGGLRSGFAASGRLRYGASSFLEDPGAPAADPETPPATVLSAEYLALPLLDSRIPELARTLTAGLSGGENRARAIEKYLRATCRYTTELPDQAPADPLAHFLFERRQGHCEYFASAMAVLLRASGVPARVANGFGSGVYNPISGWQVIRATDAHSWVEAYLDGRGWTAFDPTPASAPADRFALLSRLSLYLDAADTFWQEWVLSYDLNRQLVLASRMEDSSRAIGVHWFDRFRAAAVRWKRGVTAAAGVYGPWLLALAALAAAAWWRGPRAWRRFRTSLRLRQLRRGGARPHHATLLYERLLGVLKRRGFEKPPWLTPLEFARVLPPALSGPAGEFTAAYNDLRFGGRPGAAARMTELLARLEKVS